MQAAFTVLARPSVPKAEHGFLSVLRLAILGPLEFSFLLLFAILLGQKKAALLFSFRALEYFKSAILGLLNPFLFYVVIFTAYSRLLGQEAMVLNYVWPIVLVLLSALLLRQALGLKIIFALLLSFFGVVLIATRGNPASFTLTDPLGISLALGSSIAWALFWVLNVKDKRDETVKLCLNFFFGSLYAFIMLFALGRFALPVFEGWLGITYVACFEMGLTFLLWLKAMQLTRTTALIGNLVFISPFLSLIFLNFILGEKLFLSTFLGLIFIVGGIFIQRWFDRKTGRVLN